MKISVKEGSENYACSVISLPIQQPVPGLDKLVKVTVFGNDCLISKGSDESDLYLFFPAECAISSKFLSANNLYREAALNSDRTKTGFFEASGRVKAIKFKGVISTGFIIPVTALDNVVNYNLTKGDEFTDINGEPICWKYRVERQRSEKLSRESRFNKKLKRFSKLVQNQFRFHDSTSHLAKNLHALKEDDIVVITDKWHGTSAVFANVLVNKQLTWKEKLAKWLGVEVVDKVYDILYSSRSVIKNEYVNPEAGPGYYGEDIYGTVKNELEGKIEQGITIYGEIVGFTTGGRAIQKNYDYGCVLDGSGPQHKFRVYRMTYTKPDGNVIELTWQQIKNYCAKYELETVPEIFFGKIAIDGSNEEEANEFLKAISADLLEKKCQHCKNDVWAEGICLRIDGQDRYTTFKLKSKNFLEGETKSLDKGEIDVESEESVLEE